MALMKSASHYKKKLILPMCLFSVVPMYIGLIIAPYSDKGITYFIFDNVDLTTITWCGMKSIKIMAICLFIYAVAAIYYYTSLKNTRRDQENGSIHWGDPYSLTKKYADRSKKIITKEEAIRTNQTIISKKKIEKPVDADDVRPKKHISWKECVFYLIVLAFVEIIALYLSITFGLNTFLLLISGTILTFIGIGIRLICFFKKGGK